MPKNEEMTPAEARKIVEDHEKKHGKDMSDKIPPGQLKKDDVPTQAELDEEPDWFKQGKKRPAHPDD